MSSTTPPGTGPVTVPELCAAVAEIAALVDLVAGALVDPDGLDRGAMPDDVAAELAIALLRASDQGSAAATALVGQVTATTGPGTGALIAGRYASPRRWLEVEAGLSSTSAKALVARSRDLREHSAPVREGWLSGRISGDKVRLLVSGVSGVLATLPATREEKRALRAESLEVLMPVAVTGTAGDLGRALGRVRLLAESAVPRTGRTTTQRAAEAYDDQRLTCVQVGDLFRLEAWLTPEAGAATMTVIDQCSRRIADRDPEVVHDSACPLAAPPHPVRPGATGFPPPAWCTCGGSAAAGIVAKDNWPHLRAVAFGEVMADLLDNASVGSHHGVAPHVTVQIGLDELRAGLGAELTMPGHDEPVLISSAAARRIMCDASITPVVVDRRLRLEAETGTDRLAKLLMSTAVTVLYVGRTQRTASLAQRRALEARDRHCLFPGCRAHPRRCQAHHVQEWENSGGTDLDNLCLLCPRHHRSVHEGGWTLHRTPGTSPYETGCWTLAPPRLQP